MNIFEEIVRCCSATIANYQIVCCEAVRSPILATAWLLVHVRRLMGAASSGHQGTEAGTGHDVVMDYSYMSFSCRSVGMMLNPIRNMGLNK